jgi:hypothetical protein
VVIWLAKYPLLRSKPELTGVTDGANLRYGLP